MTPRIDIEDMTDAQDEAPWQRSEAELRLLPCPFCGNDGSGPIEDALHIAFNEYDFRASSWSVQCDKCTANMGHSDSEDEAVEAWNRRADPAREKIDRLAETCGYAISQWEDWVRDQLEGTSKFSPAMAEIEATRAAVRADLARPSQAGDESVA